MSDGANILDKPQAPWHAPSFWWVMGSLLVAILALTMAKDDSLTGAVPNSVFYLTVPLVSMVGSASGGFVTARFLRQIVGLSDLLAISLITIILGQVFENGSKLAWYLLWEYPGWLYLAAILALGLAVPAWCLLRWLRLRLGTALLVAVGMFLGELGLTLAFTSFTGVSTPGS